MAGPYQRLANGQSADSGAQAITTVVNAIEAGLEDAEATIATHTTDIAGKAATSHTHTGTYDPAGSAATAQAAAVQRANHTGTQVAATISDFNTAVRTNRLDQMAAPTAAVGMGSQRVTNVATPTATTDAANKAYADSVAGTTEPVKQALAQRSVQSRIWPATMSSPPTVTVGSAAAATSVSNSARVKANDAAFTYTNCNVTSAGSITGSETYSDGNVKQTNTTINYNLIRTVFETDASDFEFIVQVKNGTYSYFTILVDGERVAAKTQLTTDASVRRIRVQFGSATARQITFEGQYVWFIGVQKPLGRSLWKADFPLGPTVAVPTDSWGTGGSSVDTAFSADAVAPYVWDGFPMRLHYALGWNVYPIPGPSTGYNETPDAVNLPALKDRLSDINGISPDIVVYTMGLNDRAGTLATVESTINTVMANCATNNPTARVLVCGPGKPKDGVSAYSTLPTISTYLSNAATANGFTFVSTTDWITGTGCLGTVTNVGNSDTACSADQIHLTPDGYAYWGRRLAAACRTWLWS